MKKETKQICRQAAAFYYDYINEPSEVPASIREHLEQCRNCREEFGRLKGILERPEPAARSVRAEILRSQVPLYEQWVGCRQVRPFLPLLAAGELVPSVPTPAAAHLTRCPLCRQDLTALKGLTLSAEQALAAARVLSGDKDVRVSFAGACAELLQAMEHRADSDVLTKLSRNSDGSFEVAVAQRAAEPNKAAAVRRRALGWLRYAAAAVLLISVYLLWLVRPVRGLDISEVYKLLEQPVNAAITSYPQDNQNLIIASRALEEQRPFQEIWISKSLEVYLFVGRDSSVLWDLNRHHKYIKTAAGIERIPITQPVKKFEIPWGLLPFRCPSELPDKYKWKMIRPEEPTVPNVQVYDLTWTDFSALGYPIERRWRGYLDTRTKLPVRIDWWERLEHHPFQKVSTTLIRYPQDAEVLSRIAAEGFDYRPAVQK
ncbi:MAG: hypothetical protein WHS88_02870 [Anaerohalosphaeraceae bacterium]